MDPLMALRQNIRHLTVDHQRLITRDGRVEAMESAGLLKQLREEIVDGSVKERTGTSSGAFVPINLGALDVMSAIETDLKDELRRWGLRPLPAGLEMAVRSWGRLVSSIEDLQAPAAAISGKWVKAIMDLFEPVRVVTIRGDCPNCGITAADNGRMDDEGEWVPVQPLTRVDDRAACSMCEWAWNGVDELTVLGAALQQMEQAAPLDMLA